MPLQPTKISQVSHPSSLKILAESFGERLISSVLTAVAASIALVALSFAIYAGFKELVTPPWASACTAAVFAAVAGIFAIVVPRSIKARKNVQIAELEADRPGPSRAVVRTAVEIAFAVVGAAAETALSRRHDRRSGEHLKLRHQKPKRR